MSVLISPSKSLISSCWVANVLLSTEGNMMLMFVVTSVVTTPWCYVTAFLKSKMHYFNLMVLVSRTSYASRMSQCQLKPKC